MNKKTFLSFGIVCIFVVLVGFFVVNNRENLSEIEYVEIAGINIKVDLALTPAQLAQGLSGRTELEEDEGMLFVFDRPDKYLFWMKNMNFPIDMIWIGEDLKIVYIKHNALPENFLETYGPDTDAKYVLEVVAGFSEKNNLKKGDEIFFTY